MPVEVRDEILDLMNDKERQPKTETEALTWLLLLQWVARDFYAVERPKPKLMDRQLYMARLRPQLEAIRLKAVTVCPEFEVLRQYSLLMKTWADMTNIGVGAIPNSGAVIQEHPPEFVSDALTTLIADHCNFSRGYAALSWVKNTVRLEINMEQGNAGQQEDQG